MAEDAAKPAQATRIVSDDAETLLSFHREAFGFEELPGLQIPGVGMIHELARGESVRCVFEPEKTSEPDVVTGDFASRAGFRYLNLDVCDACAVVEAARAVGGRGRRTLRTAPRPNRFSSERSRREPRGGWEWLR